MKRFVEGRDRQQGVLLAAYLDDYVLEENPVRVVHAFIDELDLDALGFASGAGADGSPGLSPGGAAEDLSLRLSQPSSVEPSA